MPGPLDGFTPEPFTHGGATRDVWVGGEGPAVVVVHEIPGITPKVADFGRRVIDRGMSVFMPDLVGTVGKEPAMPYILSSMARVCVAREFTMLATGKTSPIIEWLKALSRTAHQRGGGPGVGAVGMCFSGGFALGMMVDPVVVAPVLSQPSSPFPLTRSHRRDLGVSPSDLEVVKERAADGCQVLGLRFTNDRMAPGDRFDALRRQLGEAFIGVEIDSSKGNPWGNKSIAHSVLTEDLQDVDGHPTRDALHQVLDFFADRLL